MEEVRASWSAPRLHDSKLLAVKVIRMSPATVKREWATVKLWLRHEIAKSKGAAP
jgi:hypothetical protein